MPSSILRLGDTAPDFTADTTHGKISFHSWLNDSWCVLFSHPADFTPVCTTELGTLEKLHLEFKRRKCKIIGLSCDDLKSHFGWIKDIIETQNIISSDNNLSYPIIADKNRKIAKLYNMLDSSNVDKEGLPLTVRSVFVLDNNKKIRLTLTYPATTGRNFDEILRAIDSLQLTDYYKVATPANWKNGGNCVIVPSVSDTQAKTLFPRGFKKVRPYLRLTPQPNLGKQSKL